MSSVNKVIIVGHLGKDPEVRSFPNGDQVANVTIATTDKWKDKQTGELKEATEWHRVVFNGRLAEIASQYLAKGSQVYIEGGLRTRKWTDQSGVEKYTTEIRADNMQMLSKRPDGGGQNSGGRDGGNGGGYDNNAPRQQVQGNNQQQQQRQAPQGNQGYGNSQQRQQPAQNQQRQAPRQQSSGFDDMDDDIPF